MITWYYTAFGFALISILLRGERRKREEYGFRKFYLDLCLTFSILFTIDLLLSTFLWNPFGRNDLRFVSLFLWAAVLDQGMSWFREKTRRSPRTQLILPLLVSPSLIVLFGLSVWAIESDNFFAGLGLVIATGVVEWLLEGLRMRLRLSDVPEVLGGATIIFWLAAILFLGAWGLGSIIGHL